MPRNRQIYLLDPQQLPPETIAVTFAKTSRSPQSFREIAAELTEAKSADFHEKWVVGYGHSSVAEHAVLHIAAENISRLAVECLESNRLASYTEKSTRYQQWGLDDFYRPAELQNHLLQGLYEDTCRSLFETYTRCLEPVQQVIAAENPPREGETPSAWERRVRPQAVDVCRFLLPAAALANVGMTINARALEHAIRKMLSHPLMEVRAMGEEIKAAALESTPTLVKYADAVPYLQTVREALTPGLPAEPAMPAGPGETPWCRLLDWDRDADLHILAAALYRHDENGYAHAIEQVRNLSAGEQARLAAAILGSLGPHDIPIRELEFSFFVFDIILDQGAYAELKRHRMMTQTPQELTPLLGYAIPRCIRAAGMETDYRRAMETARETYLQLHNFNPAVASYVVPNGYNRRVLLSTNLRSLMHFVSLRSAPNAHFSIRRIAHRMAELARETMPLLGDYLTTAPGESWQDVEKMHFAETKAGDQ
ncbi:MAG TPA: FAD-dependent thymidylate synthase [Anaerolineaceae bacterium]|nr:FAD-dependent thymidylate synthase [Anaerolineaceae bacterium]